MPSNGRTSIPKEQEFTVSVCRIGYAHGEVKVRAISRGLLEMNRQREASHPREADRVRLVVLHDPREGGAENGAGRSRSACR